MAKVYTNIGRNQLPLCSSQMRKHSADSKKFDVDNNSYSAHRLHSTGYIKTGVK